MTEVTNLFFPLVFGCLIDHCSTVATFLKIYFVCKYKFVLIELQEASVVGDGTFNKQTPSEGFSGKVDR